MTICSRHREIVKDHVTRKSGDGNPPISENVRVIRFADAKRVLLLAESVDDGAVQDDRLSAATSTTRFRSEEIWPRQLVNHHHLAHPTCGDR